MKCMKSASSMVLVVASWLSLANDSAQAQRWQYRSPCRPFVVYYYETCRSTAAYSYSHVPPAPDIYPVSPVDDVPPAPWPFEEIESADDREPVDDITPFIPPAKENELAFHFGGRISLRSFDAGLDPQKLEGHIGCGPFAVASLFHALERSVTNSDFQQIHQSLDPELDGTHPGTLTSYLEPNFEVTEPNLATANDLARQLALGLPAIVVVDTPLGPHWALVTGYLANAQGEFVSWSLFDAGVVKGEMPHEDFLDIWNGDAYQNYCVFVRPRGALPATADLIAPNRSQQNLGRLGPAPTTAAHKGSSVRLGETVTGVIQRTKDLFVSTGNSLTAQFPSTDMRQLVATLPRLNPMAITVFVLVLLFFGAGALWNC